MSLDATRLAWLQQGLRLLEKLVLLALADRADAGNRAFPSYEILKQDTGADRKTIWRAPPRYWRSRPARSVTWSMPANCRP